MQRINKKKLYNILKIVGLLFIIIGFCTVVYPHLINEKYTKETRKNMEEMISMYQNDAEYRAQMDKLYEFLKKENERIYESKQEALMDPFTSAAEALNLEPYGIKDGIIGYIIIPRMNVEIPIYLGAGSDILNKGVGHIINTSYPIGGNNTNSVLAAHRGHSKLNLFRDIDKLKTGDKIYIQNFREAMVFEVFETAIIFPNEIDKLLIRENMEMITLISCHPKYIDNKRYVVYAKRVEE